MRPDDEDVFLDRITNQLDQLLAGSPGERLDGARSLVQQAMLSTLPDGSWPDAHLVQEALRAYLDLVELTLAEDETLGAGLARADLRWIDACRRCVDSIELLDSMLWDLRADIPQRGPNW